MILTGGGNSNCPHPGGTGGVSFVESKEVESPEAPSRVFRTPLCWRLLCLSSSGPSSCLYSPECVEGDFCEVRAATTTALPNGASLFALFFVRLQDDHRRAVPK